MSPRRTLQPSRAAGKGPKPKPPRPKAAPSGATSSSPRWLLLIHQIPPKPDYLRVKIGRRLQSVGAVAIKNSVYVLPPSADAHEDFQWIVREIEEGGGEAFVSEASLIGEGLTDDAVRARFDAARDEEYLQILADAKALMKVVRGHAVTAGRAVRKARAKATTPGVEQELAKLRRRYESASAIDFFGAPQQRAVAEALATIQDQLRRHASHERERRRKSVVDGATWVTRRGVHVDRIASAWLIRRFIDRRPRFRFVDPARYVHTRGEFRFDMFEAEYTHVGDACTFETLVSTFVPDDGALREIAEIVHDIDCKDAKFHRDEAAGLARLIAGIAALHAKDEDRVEHGAGVFDALYAALGPPPAR